MYGYSFVDKERMPGAEVGRRLDRPHKVLPAMVRSLDEICCEMEATALISRAEFGAMYVPADCAAAV